MGWENVFSKFICANWNKLFDSFSVVSSYFLTTHITNILSVSGLKSQLPEQVLYLLILSIGFLKILLAITFLSLGFLQHVDSNNGEHTEILVELCLCRNIIFKQFARKKEEWIKIDFVIFFSKLCVSFKIKDVKH